MDKNDILQLVSTYIKEKHRNKTWVPGKDWVQYSGPYFSDTEYVAAISTLLDEWLVEGNDCTTFENKVATILGKQYGVVTNSGSSANLLMLSSIIQAITKGQLRWKPKVITPVAGFPTTVNPIFQTDCIPIFVDIELDTLNIDINQFEEAAKHADFVTFAHVLGNPPNMERIMQICDKYTIPLLEDCCDALGSTYDGKELGSFGVMSTCSFYPAHHITIGEGGLVACNDESIEKIIRSLRGWGRGCYCSGKKANLSINGMCGKRFSDWIPAFKNEIFDHKYVYSQIGYNLKPIELQCSMGLAQLEKLPEIHKRRKENYTRLLQIFSNYKEFFHLHLATPKSDPSWFAFPITVKDSAPFKRSDFTRYMENNKIQTRNYFGGNLLLQPAYQYSDWYSYKTNKFIVNDINLAKTEFPIATKVMTSTLFLGTSPVITTKQLDYIEETTINYFKNL